MSGAGEGHGSSSLAAVREIAIGGARLHDQIAFITEVYAPEIEGIQVDGMVGFELFRRALVQIDYGRELLRIAAPGQLELAQAG